MEKVKGAAKLTAPNGGLPEMPGDPQAIDRTNVPGQNGPRWTMPGSQAH